jgi:hypothetical protein
MDDTNVWANRLNETNAALRKARSEKTRETHKWKQLYANIYANFASQPNINLVEPHPDAKTEVGILLGQIAKKRVEFRNDGDEVSGCSVTVRDDT